MGKTLVLAEKPSVARDIAKVLNSNQKGNGFLSGSKYVVTWALGHNNLNLLYWPIHCYDIMKKANSYLSIYYY